MPNNLHFNREDINITLRILKQAQQQLKQPYFSFRQFDTFLAQPTVNMLDMDRIQIAMNALIPKLGYRDGQTTLQILNDLLKQEGIPRLHAQYVNAIERVNEFNQKYGHDIQYSYANVVMVSDVHPITWAQIQHQIQSLKSKLEVKK